jgi:molybdenum cofactor biosynthesis protein B
MSSVDQPKQFIPLNIAVLTISDTRSLADDKSGTILSDRLTAAGHKLAAREIVTDDVDAIRAIVRKWIADAGVDAIITTGGTGFTGRDVTPEAIEPLFEKRMDGFSIAFHMLSHAKIGASTIQSRATAGRPARHLSSACRDRPAPAATAGTAFWRTSSIIARGPAISSRSCRGSMSTCGGRRPRARRHRIYPSFRGARLRANPESITTIGGYGFRACAKRRIPE